MKTLKVFLIIVLGAITMVSCEKDEPKPTPTEWDNLLISISKDMEEYNKYLSENIFREIQDTMFVYDPVTGLVAIDPATGLPLYNGINIVYNDFANAKRMSENYANDKMLLLAQKLWEWQSANSNKRGTFSSSNYEDCIIVIKEIDGKSLQQDIAILNDLGKLVIQYQNLPPITIIRNECTKLIPKAKKASVLHLEEVVIEGPGQKMAMIIEYETKMTVAQTKEAKIAIQKEFTEKSQGR